jgi:hypothetical protein
MPKWAWVRLAAARRRSARAILEMFLDERSRRDGRDWLDAQAALYKTFRRVIRRKTEQGLVLCHLQADEASLCFYTAPFLDTEPVVQGRIPDSDGGSACRAA